MKGTYWYSGLLTLVAAGAWNVLAPRPLDADPPARVGRLNYMNGSVSLRPAGSDEWSAAVPNRPLTSGDRLWTDNDARAEVHVGSTAIRLNAQTELDFTNVDDNTLQLRLAQGSMSIRVRHLGDGQVYEIDAPNGAISLGRDGDYRVDVNADGTTSVVTVWSGSAEVTSAGSSFAIDAHQRASVNGTDAPTYDLTDAPSYDAWDQWCLSRDQREDGAVSARYVSREMTGYEDLDQYGQWRYVGEYGEVWVPADEPAGWAPYHTGHWVWVDPWGWTWVDDAPWGYAPYHYGRWAYVDGYWAWVPGRVIERPVYAPALVVFVGGGAPRSGVAVGIGGAVAWFALGPEEVYRPAYATSPQYVQQVNVTNVTNVTNITNVTNVTNTTNVTNVTNVQYRNRNAPGAMAATSGTAFATAQPVQRTALPVTTELRQAPVTGTAPAIAPTRASLALAPSAGANGTVRTPPAVVADRPVLAKLAPPPAPVPFAAKQQALAANAGRPLTTAQEAHIRSSLPVLARGTVAPVRPAAVALAGGGLKAARTGLPAATPVTGGSSAGFVSAPAAVARPTTGPTTGPATGTTTAGPTATTTGPATTAPATTAPPTPRVAQPPSARPVAQPPATPIRARASAGTTTSPSTSLSTAATNGATRSATNGPGTTGTTRSTPPPAVRAPTTVAHPPDRTSAGSPTGTRVEQAMPPASGQPSGQPSGQRSGQRSAQPPANSGIGGQSNGVAPRKNPGSKARPPQGANDAGDKGRAEEKPPTLR